MSDHTDVAKKTVRGSLYSVGASVITLGLGVVRTFLLIYWLKPDERGVFAQAVLILLFIGLLRIPGLDRAIIQLPTLEKQTLPTYFTFRMGIVSAVSLLTLITTPLIVRFYPDFPQLAPVLLTLLLIEFIKSCNGVQETLLQRNLAFRRIALANVISSIVMTAVAPTMAWLGYGVWALVSEQAAGQAIRVAVFWLYKRVWTPSFGWDRATARHLWQFGATVWVARGANMLNDHFDDFWVGRILGANALGIYAAAYDFAGYPSRVIANPILTVFFSTFARLQDNRHALSQAFFRAVSLIVRTGFFFALLFVLLSPEIIGLFSAEWQPMIPIFQLFIVYTLLDPLVLTTGNLLLACGSPELYTRVRICQLVLFIPAVILLTDWLDLVGVALAANLMVVVGTVLLFFYAKRFVTFSTRRLLQWPTVATVLTLFAIWQFSRWTFALPVTVLLKVVIITAIYSGTLFLTERKILLANANMIFALLRRR